MMASDARYGQTMKACATEGEVDPLVPPSVQTAYVQQRCTKAATSTTAPTPIATASASSPPTHP